MTLSDAGQAKVNIRDVVDYVDLPSIRFSLPAPNF